MKSRKYKTISIICSLTGIVLAGVFLFFGISAIGASGLAGLGTIVIIPSLAAMAIIIVELLITTLSKHKGLLFSYILGVIKLIGLAVLLYVSCKDLMYELQYGNSDITLDLMAVIVLIILSFPTLFNILRLRNHRQK